MTIPSQALIWGCISALSLPMGAMVGIWIRPVPRVTSAMMAFGGGALLFALTIELFAHSLHISHQGHDISIILATMAGAVLGGVLFETLNQILNNKGAFFRKISLVKKQIRRVKRKNAREMIQSLSRIKFLTVLPPEEFVHMIPHLRVETYSPESVLFRQGDTGRRLYFIVYGKVQVIRDTDKGSHIVAELGPGDVLGEIALLLKEPRLGTAKALTELKAYTLHQADFDQLLRHSSKLQEACRKIVKDRIEDLQTQQELPPDEARMWRKKALYHLKHVSIPVTEKDLEHETQGYPGKNAALSIWLGIALDGIPESLVIGMLVVAAAASGTPMSLAFIAGVFLANFPEAMSSAVTMKRQGTGLMKIFWMWTSLCIMTGAGAFLGAVIFPADPQGSLAYFVSGIEGLAAGAMLTMIADTMLPEAFEQGGGAIAGLSTLAGFLTALGVKLLGMY